MQSYAFMLFLFMVTFAWYAFFLGGVTPNSMYYSRGVSQNSTNSYQGEGNPIFTRTYYLDGP